MDVTVLGLGMMGARLAALLLAADARVSVWNRSPGRMEPLVRGGARPAGEVAEAVRAGQVVVVCVKDYAVATALLASAAGALRERTVLHVSTGAPQEALALEALVRGHGGHYLDGAIQASPDHMGQPDTPILVSGARTALERSEAVLRIFGGPRWLGERASLANAMDFATLSYIYGAMAGFFHGARVAEAEGLRVDQFAEVVDAMAPSFGAFLKHEGLAIHADNYAISQSPLRISVDATARIAEHARQRGLDPAIPDLFAALFRDAAQAGHANEEAAAVMKLLRGRSRPGS